MSWVTRHLLHLFTHDCDFLVEWQRLPSACRADFLRRLQQLDRQRTELARTGASLACLHRRATEGVRVLFGEISECDPPVRVSISQALALAADTDGQRRAHADAAEWLRTLIEGSPVPVVRCYGGVKGPAAVAARLAAHHAGAPLDLDDLIRFRIVLPSRDELCRFARYFVWETEVLRCRDYYRRPRGSAENPYRAVHFVTRGTLGTIVEVQLQTALRDLVGMIDHSLVCKPSVSFLSRAHQQWLFDISRLANVADAEPVDAAERVNANVPARVDQRWPLTR